MATMLFDFNGTKSGKWSMREACTNPSFNPAPDTDPCIYIIHNENTRNTYVGYAASARHRWITRVEAFHCMGIDSTYGKQVKCAWCLPKYSDQGGPEDVNTPAHWTDVPSNELEGKQKAEHLLIRAVVNGVLGKVTCTNTQISKENFNSGNLSRDIGKVIVYLPSSWKKIETSKQKAIGNSY